MAKFNNGKPYHGSEEAMDGGLKGSTDTDYFYFYCPKCPNNQILRILDYKVSSGKEGNRYNAEFNKQAACEFIMTFKLYCENCNHTDFVKISNTGYQKGSLNQPL
jgi:predicted RNA-binding Zn-ribbon protein involved in translation (DUF1610 family)